MEDVKKVNQDKSEVAKREEEVLKFWQDNKIFEKTLEKDSPEGSFVFYDGPPFATGEPHYGHILAGVIKDSIPRYQTMKGKKVLRRWGWDCHGLPVENLIEKELGLKSKKDILDYGIGNFNKKAKESVFAFADLWKKVIPRSGRWVDMENDYRTMDKTYTESVWWSFKKLYDKGLIYKGFKSMHLCPRCETTLSNFEVNLGYKDITDISVYVKIELLDQPKTYLLIWTTTPWTLPGNVAMAINKDVEYVEIYNNNDDSKYILAKNRVDHLFKENFKILKNVSPLEIIGKSYIPVFDYYSNDELLENKENGWKIYDADFVTDTDGTGIVPIGSAFGQDDYELLKKHNLPFVQHVDFNGKMKEKVVDFIGLQAKPKSTEGEKDGHQKTDILIIKNLAERNILFKKEKIIHSYPHCWRCDTPLLNYATSSWFVKITDIKDKMLEENKKVNWLPKEIGQNRFGNWIEGAKDWAISRSRFWGAPLPVWVDENGKNYVFDSVNELKKRIPKRNNYFFIRHGEAGNNANKDSIMTKVDDNCHLTETGKKEVLEASNLLKDKKIDIIFSSPFIRTTETAQIIKEEIGFKDEIIFDKRLYEIQAGRFDGLTWEKYIKENFPTPRERFEKKIEGVENWGDVRKRMMDFMYDIDSKYEDKNILVVSHGAPLHLTALSSKGLSVREMEQANYYDDSFDNAEVREIDFRRLPKNEEFEVDLHRPFIDDVVLLGDDGQKLTRIPDVFDCWYESGSMFFAQQHYPFENKSEFEKEGSLLFPADFIAEGLDQTRGWFYTLLVLGTALFDKVPYKNVIVNGLVLAEDGRKMSKKLKNYPDVMDTINKYGADAVRYLLISSPLVKAEDFNFSEKAVDDVYKKIVLKLENILSLYEMYKDDFPNNPKETILDTWIVDKLTDLSNSVSFHMDRFELDKASRPIIDFIDDFSVWYIRRSRERFKSDDVLEKSSALFYTHFVLKELSKLVAPFMPFLAEGLYQRLKNEKDPSSVHLCSWPVYQRKVNNSLLEEMTVARQIVSKVLMQRDKVSIKVRQPLSLVKVNTEIQKDLIDIIKDEVNVKEVIIDPKIDDIYLDTNLTDELIKEGMVRELIRAIQDSRKKENLVAKDVIKLSISCDQFIKDLIIKNEDYIKKVVGALDIEFNSLELPYVLNIKEYSLSFGIKVL